MIPFVSVNLLVDSVSGRSVLVSPAKEDGEREVEKLTVGMLAGPAIPSFPHGRQGRVAWADGGSK